MESALTPIVAMKPCFSLYELEPGGTTYSPAAGNTTYCSVRTLNCATLEIGVTYENKGLRTFKPRLEKPLPNAGTSNAWSMTHVQSHSKARPKML